MGCSQSLGAVEEVSVVHHAKSSASIDHTSDQVIHTHQGAPPVRENSELTICHGEQAVLSHLFLNTSVITVAAASEIIGSVATLP